MSHEYIYNNNLYNKAEQNKDPEAKTGFFDHKRRVRCQTFRGEKNEAYVANLGSLNFTGIDISTLSVGDKFNELNAISICNKYITEATKNVGMKNKVNTQAGYNKAALKKLFPEHIDTEQIRHAYDSDLVGLVTITHKLHGTSARTGHIKFPEKQKYSWWNRIVEAITLNKLQEYINKWQYILGTRRVIKGKVKEDATDYRSLCALALKPYIQKGEIWYYEIVGYEDSGKSIMPTVCTDIMPKEFRKRFGDTITYKYGCLLGTWDIYVYRITVQNEDNDIYELPWSMVKDKCNRAGIKHVPEIDQILVTYPEQMIINYYEIDCQYDDGHARWTVKEYIEHLTEDIDIGEPIDQSHIREGVCVRVDNLKTGKMEIFKNKTFAFKVLEGIQKDSGVVDTEEAESIGDE